MVEISRRTLLTASVASAGAALLPTGTATAETLEERALAMKPPVFLLESAVPPHLVSEALSITDQRAVCGTRSLRWDHGARATITVKAPLGWSPDAYRPGDDQAWQGLVDTFSVWIHNETPADDVIRFEFGRGERTDLWFEFKLGFSGWRTAWVRYAYDMHGRPHPDMDTVRIIAPARQGTLWLDQLILNASIRPDGPCRDFQLPDIGREQDEYDHQHWQALYLFDQLLQEARPGGTATDAEKASLRKLRAAYTEEYLTAKVTVDVAALTAQVAAMENRPVHAYQREIYPQEIAAELRTFVNAVTLRAVTDLMKTIAQAYDQDRTALGALYLRLVRLLREQGWTRGSCQGTIHHLGYDVRGLYDSVFLMREPLREAGEFEQVRADLGWLTGFGRVFRGWEHRWAHGSTMDILNTTVRGMLAYALLRDTEDEQVAYLKVFVEWLNTALLPTTGIQDGIKVDGTTFHHIGFFPDYARDGFGGVAPIVYLLSQGVFAVKIDSLKKALLTMRVYANRNNWPISISGRNPSGATSLSLVPYMWMSFDDEIGAAYLRLLPAVPTAEQKKWADRVRARGVAAEATPTGNWALNYGAMAVHRRGEWQVSARGHNRYLWSTEIYVGANWYGRYNTYGQVQVLRGSNAESGYAPQGYDWNRRPGTTTIHKPLDQLRGDLTGAIEEMLLSDSRFAGANSIDGRNGMFAMELHGHPKYDGSHRARKSVFFFDDRVVAVGTGIQNDDAANETETTLFQTRRTGSVLVDGQETPFPYTGTDLSARWLLDDKGIGYHLPIEQKLCLTRSTQSSRDHATEAPTSGDFSTAWLRHGTAPTAGSYQYAMLIDATPERMAAFPPYTIVRADNLAHVVSDQTTGITGYAVFERTSFEGSVRAVDTPCLVLTRPEDDGLVLAVCDPDLRLYGGIDHDQYEHGRYVGHYSPWSRPWLTNPSHPHRLRVTLEGRWQAGEDQPCRVLREGDRSVVEFTTADGRPLQVLLQPA